MDPPTVAIVVSILSLVVSLGGIGSLLVSRRSLHVSRRSLHVTANQYASNMAIAAGHVFIEYPHLRPYFYEGGFPPAKIRNQVVATATNQLDVMEAIWDHHDEFDDQDREAWREWMHDMLQTSPTMREWCDLDWYPSLKSMLSDAVCRWPDKHECALSDALQRAQDELRGSGPAKEPPATVNRQRELLMEVADRQRLLGRLDCAVVLAAAWPWPPCPWGPARRKDPWLQLAGLRARLPWRRLGPRLPDGLRDLLLKEKDEGNLELGRQMSLGSAIEYAVRDVEAAPAATLP